MSSFYLKENNSNNKPHKNKQGFNIAAESLKTEGLEYCFGVAEAPVVQLSLAILAQEIKYHAFKSQKGAIHAAGAIGYLTGKPGICLFGKDFDIVNTIEALSNAWVNGWPLVLISGCKDIYNQAKGTPQEIDKKPLNRFFMKYHIKITSVQDIPFCIQKAISMSISGRPGPVYIEIPGNILNQQIGIKKLSYPMQMQLTPLVFAPNQDILIAADLLKNAKNPLVVIGPLESGAEAEIKKFINKTYFPFLPTVLGKGVISDKHNCCVAQAKNYALLNADIILLVGTSLNLIPDLGDYPRINRDTKIIQIFNDSEYFNYFVQGAINILGDIQDTSRHLYLEMKGFNCRQIQIQWWQILQQIIHRNEQINKFLLYDDKLHLSFYSTLGEIINVLPKEFIFVCEGEELQNMARGMINMVKPKNYLCAGSSQFKGMSIPYCIAAKCSNRQKPVVCIFDDISFTKSSVDIETSAQYKMPFIAIIFNTKKYSGLNDNKSVVSQNGRQQHYQFTPNPSIRYEKVADNFGGVGILVTNHKELKSALSSAFNNLGRMYIINVLIDQPLNQTDIEQKVTYFKNSGILPKL